MAEIPNDPQKWAWLVQLFRPIYKLHSEEMFYPMHFEELMKSYMSLVRVDGQNVTPIIPFLLVTPDTALATDAGIAALKTRGITLDAQTISDLRPKLTSSPAYTYLQRGGRYLFQYVDDGHYATPIGNIWSKNFSPANSTWYHRGAANCDLTWAPPNPSGYNCAALARIVVNGNRASTREPTVLAWVLRHSAGSEDWIDFIYTCYFGYNGSISIIPGQGEHFNDIVTNAVRFRATDLNKPVRYYFGQHGGYAWYEPEQVKCNGDQLIVYLARQSHESYPVAGRFTRLFGIADDITDDGGVTWTPDAEYVNRPHGIDSQGIDTDALRCQINPESPQFVVLVPTDTPGPLWQYAGFPFVQKGGDGLNTDLVSQGNALFTDKWWPGEGPYTPVGRTLEKAADPSALGVPGAFFDNVASFWALNPMPACSHAAAAANHALAMPAEAREDLQEPRFAGAPPSAQPADFVTATALSGDVIAQAGAEATFLDWTGDVGTYLFGGLQQFGFPFLRDSLQDPMPVDSPWSYDVPLVGTLGLSPLSITGLKQIKFGSIVAVNERTLAISATLPSLQGAGSLILAGAEAGGVTVLISEIQVNVKVDMLTPLGRTAQVPSQWYVPYLGPSPYSYNSHWNQGYEQTKVVSHAIVTDARLGFSGFAMSLSGLLLVLRPITALIELALNNFCRDSLGALIADVAKGQANSLIVDVYSGKRRIG